MVHSFSSTKMNEWIATEDMLLVYSNPAHWMSLGVSKENSCSSVRRPRNGMERGMEVPLINSRVVNKRIGHGEIVLLTGRVRDDEYKAPSMLPVGRASQRVTHYRQWLCHSQSWWPSCKDRTLLRWNFHVSVLLRTTLLRSNTKQGGIVIKAKIMSVSHLPMHLENLWLCLPYLIIWPLRFV